MRSGLVALVLVFALSIRISSAQTSWNVATGQWHEPANWSAGLPNSSTNAIINNGGTSQVTTSGAVARDLFVGDAATGTLELSDSGSLTSRNTVIGNLDTGDGILQASGVGTVWTNTFSFTVGLDGHGKIRILDGASVSSSSTSLGDGGGSYGEALVTGPNSTWTVSLFDIGEEGAGTLTISEGATVTSGTTDIASRSGSHGTVLVTGSGTTWQTSSIDVGDSGVGLLTIADGAVVTSISGDIGGFDGLGDATVTGADSQWNFDSSLTVGLFATGSLMVTDGASVKADTATIGAGSNGVGNLEVSGSTTTFVSEADLTVGNSGTGTLTISTGSVAVAHDTFVGRWSTSAGTIHFENGTLNTGGLATGLDDLAGEGIVNTHGLVTDIDLVFDANHGLQQQIAVNGLPGQDIVINLDAGEEGSLGAGYRDQGSLTIADGVEVESRDGYLAVHSGSVGTASVSGAGSRWSMTGALTVGYSGNATLTIAEGGLVETGGDTYIRQSTGNSSIQFDHGTLTTKTLWAGTPQLQGTGTVHANGLVSDLDLIFDETHGLEQQLAITSPAQNITIHLDLDGTGVLGAGYASDGSLTIADGVDVASTAGWFGYHSGSKGVAVVSGTGTSWNISQDLMVGRNGVGELTIAGGATVTNGNAKIGRGKVVVTGSGSTWSNAALSLGEFFSTAELLVSDGGRVTSTSESFSTFSSGIATSFNSNAKVTITGIGSEWSHTGSIAIGGDGNGVLFISDGGTVTNGSASIGGTISGNGSGSVTVTGPGSTWLNDGPLSLGSRGSGALTIAEGGRVTSASGGVSSSFTSTGTVNISGQGSVWEIAGDLRLGGFASSSNKGTIVVGPGSALQVGGETLIDSSGVLRLEGGTLASQSIRPQFFGAPQFLWTSGTLHVGTYQGNLVHPAGTLAPGSSAGSTTIAGNYTQGMDAVLQIEIGGPQPGADHDVVNVSGTVTLGGTLQLAMLSGYVPSDSDTFNVLVATGNLTGMLSNVESGGRLETSDGIGSFLVHYGVTSPFFPKQVVLSDFEINGDFNQDGSVDGADYVVWRKTLTGNDVLDQQDHASWQRNYGISVSTAGSTENNILMNVPEPCGLLTTMLLIACTASFAVTRREARRPQRRAQCACHT